MNSEEFSYVFEEQVDICRRLLLTKAAEYAEDDDRLHNFNVAAELQGCTREEALAGMMCKHTVSIYDMIREGANNFSMEKWDEKITDHINYLILLRALVTDELEKDQASEFQSNIVFGKNAMDQVTIDRIKETFMKTPKDKRNHW